MNAPYIDYPEKSYTSYRIHKVRLDGRVEMLCAISPDITYLQNREYTLQSAQIHKTVLEAQNPHDTFVIVEHHDSYKYKLVEQVHS